MKQLIKCSRMFALVCFFLFILLQTTSSQKIQSPRRVLIPRSADSCYVIYGRLSPYADNVVYGIWIIGTNHILNVTNFNTDDTPSLPDTLLHLDLQELILYGDFIVCPNENYQVGHMQPVKLIGASNLRLKPIKH